MSVARGTQAQQVALPAHHVPAKPPLAEPPPAGTSMASEPATDYPGGVIRGKRRGGGTESGVSAVEFALVSIPLILLVFGIIGFGFAFGQVLALNNGAREAARLSVVSEFDGSLESTCANIIQRAQDASTSLGMLDPDEITVEVRRGTTEESSTEICTGTPNLRPCENQAPDTRIYIYTRFNSSLVIPFGPSESVLPLAGKGAFKCEFS